MIDVCNVSSITIFLPEAAAVYKQLNIMDACQPVFVSPVWKTLLSDVNKTWVGKTLPMHIQL